MRQSQAASLALFTALSIASVSLAQSAAAAPVGKPVEEVHLTHVSLSDAIEYLRDVSGANIEVDWKALETVGLSKDAPVSLRLRNVSLRVALKKTLDSASPGVADFIVDGNVITITSQEAADSKLVTRIIPIGDLLLDIPDFTDAPTMDLSSATSGNSGARGAGAGNSNGTNGGNQNIFSGGTTTTADQKKVSRQEKAQQLIDTIQSTVRPSIWDVNGGKSKIKYFNNTLIITAPASVIRVIGG